MILHLNKYESPSPKNVPSLVEIGPLVLKKTMKKRKVYNNDHTSNDGQQTNFDGKSSLEPSAQMS